MFAVWKRLRADVQRLADIEAIKQLKAKYVRYADGGDWAAWGDEVLTPDFHSDNDAGPIEGRELVIALTSEALSQATAVHNLHAPEITITGPDTASAIWPVSDYITGVFKGVPMVIRGHGHYHDDYVRTPQGWRLSRCKLVRVRVDTLAGASALADSGGANLRSSDQAPAAGANR
jgi:hypothetical protein